MQEDKTWKELFGEGKDIDPNYKASKKDYIDMINLHIQALKDHKEFIKANCLELTRRAFNLPIK